MRSLRMESLRRNSYNSFGESLNSLGVGKSLASLGVVGKSPSSVDLGWGWRGGWVSRTFKRSRSAYRPKHPVIQVKLSKIKVLNWIIHGEDAWTRDLYYRRSIVWLGWIRKLPPIDEFYQDFEQEMSFLSCRKYLKERLFVFRSSVMTYWAVGLRRVWSKWSIQVDSQSPSSSLSRSISSVTQISQMQPCT